MFVILNMQSHKCFSCSVVHVEPLMSSTVRPSFTQECKLLSTHRTNPQAQVSAVPHFQTSKTYRASRARQRRGLPLLCLIKRTWSLPQLSHTEKWKQERLVWTHKLLQKFYSGRQTKKWPHQNKISLWSHVEDDCCLRLKVRQRLLAFLECKVYSMFVETSADTNYVL